jgi:hypothetical protein
MVLRLAERLEVPLRERNALLVAAGFAPMYRERALDDPALARGAPAVERILKSHEPFPALAVDRHWNLVAHNARGAAPAGRRRARNCCKPPVNVLRLSLHPAGWRRASSTSGSGAPPVRAAAPAGAGHRRRGCRRCTTNCRPIRCRQQCATTHAASTPSCRAWRCPSSWSRRAAY